MSARKLHQKISANVPTLISPYESWTKGSVRLVFAFWDYSADCLGSGAGFEWLRRNDPDPSIPTLVLGFEAADSHKQGWFVPKYRERYTYVSLASLSDPLTGIRTAAESLLNTSLELAPATRVNEAHIRVLRHDLAAARSLVEGSFCRMGCLTSEQRRRAGYEELAFLPDRLLRDALSYRYALGAEERIGNLEKLWFGTKSAASCPFSETALSRAKTAVSELITELRLFDHELKSRQRGDRVSGIDDPAAENRP